VGSIAHVLSGFIYKKPDNVKYLIGKYYNTGETVSCAEEGIVGIFVVGREAPPKAKFRGTSVAATRIDCDIHPAVSGTRTALLPYLDDQRQVVSLARGRAARQRF
jgi:hypothetical protein